MINNHTEAVIYLKNGKRKYGMLIDNVVNDAYHFISNNNYSLFKKNNNQSYIEIVPGALIETIDISIK
ncbi:hypothetical protein BH10BAC1_BH10BAC1_19290 [soil metagenome]